jgi:hypothetical protein
LAVYRRKSLRSSTGLAPHCALRDGCLLGLNCSQASSKETTGSIWTICSSRRPTPPSIQLSFSVFSQCFGFLQVGGVKPLGEPAIDKYRCRQCSLRISTAMVSITLMWRQYGHGVGCDYSVSRPITALPPFFVRTLPDPQSRLPLTPAGISRGSTCHRRALLWHGD